MGPLPSSQHPYITEITSLLSLLPQALTSCIRAPHLWANYLLEALLQMSPCLSSIRERRKGGTDIQSTREIPFSLLHLSLSLPVNKKAYKDYDSYRLTAGAQKIPYAKARVCTSPHTHKQCHQHPGMDTYQFTHPDPCLTLLSSIVLQIPTGSALWSQFRC